MIESGSVPIKDNENSGSKADGSGKIACNLERLPVASQYYELTFSIQESLYYCTTIIAIACRVRVAHSSYLWD
jgi:hypothetical protein